jgi:hypothetical protein
MKEMIMWDKYDNKYREVVDVEVARGLEADLCEANMRITDLEYSLLDMILQFADEDKNSISTMGLSALETAFAELDLDDPMPIKEVHRLYKELAKKYFEERCK